MVKVPVWIRLICYMNLPILIENKENLDRVALPEGEHGKGAVFLIDSGQIGNRANDSDFLRETEE